MSLFKLVYIVAGFIAGLIVFNMVTYGWNNSWYYMIFPYNSAQPLRIHYITMLISLFTATVSFTYYSVLGFPKSAVLSIPIPLLGLAGFELDWHYGWGPDTYNMKPDFWAMYIFMMLTIYLYVWRRVHKGRFSLVIFLSFLFLEALGLMWWLQYVEWFNFYPQLLLYESGLASNPHTTPFFILKALILSLPLVLLWKKEP